MSDSESRLKLVIRLPDRLVDECDIDYVVLPTIDGETAIFRGHEPIVTVLSGKPVRIHESEDSERKLFVTGGMVEVFQDVVTVLAHAVEDAETGDVTTSNL